MKGREVPPKPEFTFSTGVTVTLERTGTLISLPIYKRFPEPPVPTQKMEVGPDQWREVENPSDPAYRAALSAREQEIGLAIQDAMLELGVSDDGLEIDLNRVAKFRKVLGLAEEDAGGPSDKLVWIRYALVGTNDDLRRFGRALRLYDSPSEEGVASAEQTFPGELSGAQSDGDTSEAA